MNETLRIEGTQVVIPDRGITIIFGPSGCGKTRLLRQLAGLETCHHAIFFRDQCWQRPGRRLGPGLRNIAMAFQEPRLLPHKSLRDNIFLGQAAAAPLPASALLERLDLADKLDQPAGTLSGGEQQRGALARALAHPGQLLFLDEPLTGLDQQRRRAALSLIKENGQQRPVLMVTHQLDEVLALADHLLLMDGQQQFAGPLEQLINHPLLVNQRGHEFSILQGRPDQTDAGLDCLQMADGQQLRMVSNGALPANGLQRIAIDARDVSLALSPAADSSILNILRARILDAGDSAQDHSTVTLALGDQQLRALVSGYSLKKLGLRPDQWVYAQIKGTIRL